MIEEGVLDAEADVFEALRVEDDCIGPGREEAADVELQLAQRLLPVVRDGGDDPRGVVEAVPGASGAAETFVNLGPGDVLDEGDRGDRMAAEAIAQLAGETEDRAV